MMTDDEIMAEACSAVRQYRDSAWIYASRRAERLLAAKDAEGHQGWTRVLACIEDIHRIEVSDY